MKTRFRALALMLALCLLLSACGQSGVPAEEAGHEVSAELQEELSALSADVIDPDLTCTITLGNWPADTAPESELALFEGYRATMAKQYPNVTLVPDYFSYTLSNYVPMAKGGTAPRDSFS